MNAAPFWLTLTAQQASPLQWSRPAGKPPQLLCGRACRHCKPAGQQAAQMLIEVKQA